MKDQKLTTENYKGTRDFYPEDMRIRNYLFQTMKRVVESYGYEEYDGPMIESLDLYRAKTGEEIVGKQIYNFVDKGDREVAIRPEMTPTVARMVAKKLRELPRPIRWYSIPNLWRYEQPGHGRLREHWQLNVDMFGVEGFRAELEILQLSCDILFAFGAPRDSFKVRISHRKLLDCFFVEKLSLDPKQALEISKVLDKRNKISLEEYHSSLQKAMPQISNAVGIVEEYLNLSTVNIEKETWIPPDLRNEISNLFRALERSGLSDVVAFDPSIVRGFDYYTGFIFEIFDTSPKNKRSLYGGGRYDNLIGLFSKEELTGIGFGLGDVTLKDFLETHNLLQVPKAVDTIFIPALEETSLDTIQSIAKRLRSKGWKVDQALTLQKLNKQLSYAEKKDYSFVLVLGESEIQKGTIQIKHMKLREQREVFQKDLEQELQDWILETEKKVATL